MHYCLAVALAKCAVEAVTVVLCEVIPSEGLATVLVYTLENLLRLGMQLFSWREIVYLVRSSISQTWEERKETASNGCVGAISEDNLVQLRGGRDLY